MSGHTYTASEVEAAARKFGGATGNGPSWSCRCPMHDDKTASLSLSVNGDGKLLWHCHAGCSQDAVRDGLRNAGVLVNGDVRPAEPKPRRRVVKRYVYTDAQSQPVFRVVRWQPKDFNQERYEDESWIGGKGAMDGVQRVLYRLPEVIAAEEVVIVEGEKDADRLASLGIVATTSPQGAGKWQPSFAEALAGKRVVILPDNDPTGRKHVLAIAASLTGKAVSVKVVELDGLPPKGDVSDWLAAGHTVDELRELIAREPEWLAEAVQPFIRLEPGELHTITAAAAAALGRATRANPFNGFYRRGDMLVRAVRLADGGELGRAGVRRARGALVIASGEPDGLRLALAAAARWGKMNQRAKDLVAADVPIEVARSLLANASSWAEIPILTGIVEAPTLRPDGSMLDQPGYDLATGLLFDPGSIEFPPVSQRPTRDEAMAALDKLNRILAGFPFVDPGSKSVALSGIITPLVRKACRAVPLHLYSAPKMASGKSLLATVASYIATGRAPAMMPQTDDPTEERKRLLAVLLEGSAIVVIDNIERELKSDALAIILTEPFFSDRLLGVNRTVTAPSAATFMATGNNATISGDLTARSIVSTLDPQVERPEERRFDVNLHDYVPQHRGELVAAALTIVRAYLTAGEPLKGKLPGFARFEDWCRFVREPLTWLGMADPCLTRKQIEERDPVREKLKLLLTGWAEAFGTTPATVAEAIEAAEQTVTVEMQTLPKHPTLQAAIAGIAEDRGKINRVRLGNFISGHARRIEAEMRFERQGSRQGVVLWSVGFVGFVGLLPTSHGISQNTDVANYREELAPTPPTPPTPPNGRRAPVF